jgi:hypothetical protein
MSDLNLPYAAVDDMVGARYEALGWEKVRRTPPSSVIYLLRNGITEKRFMNLAHHLWVIIIGPQNSVSSMIEVPSLSKTGERLGTSKSIITRMPSSGR